MVRRKLLFHFVVQSSRLPWRELDLFCNACPGGKGVISMVALCREAYTDVAMELAISETNYTRWFRNLVLKKGGEA